MVPRVHWRNLKTIINKLLLKIKEQYEDMLYIAYVSTVKSLALHLYYEYNKLYSVNNKESQTT